MKPTLLVLAAGMGSRYGGLKQIDPIGPSGETIIDYSIHDAIKAGFGKIVFVIRESFEKEFKKQFDDKLEGRIEVDYVAQEIGKVPFGSKYTLEREKPWGTGQAILMAKDCINEPFAVINADDYYGVEAFTTISEYLCILLLIRKTVWLVINWEIRFLKMVLFQEEFATRIATII